MKTRFLIIFVLVGLFFLIPTALANTPPIHPDDLKKCLDGEFLQYDWCKRHISLQSPLKQYEVGVRYHDIQCKNDLELVGKMPYAYPACVKPESVEKLVMRGWATTDKTVELSNPLEYVVVKNSTDYEVLYSLKGATLESIVHDADANSVHVTLSDAVGGHMVISIPRDLIDAKMGNNDDDVYFLLIDGLEHMYGEKITDDLRIITVWFSKDVRDIEIIGTFWI